MNPSHSSRLIVATLALFISARMLQAADPATNLTPTPTSVSLTFTKPSTAGSAVNVSLVASSTGVYYTVDPTSVPIWLSLDKYDGTATTTSSAGGTIAFSASSVSAELGAGLFSATVKIKVLGRLDLPVPVTILIKNAAATVSVKEGTGAFTAQNWSIGSAIPSYTMTLVSSNEPVTFTAAAASTTTTNGAVANWISINRTSGVAYTWGTPITVTFNPLAFLQAQAADTITGTVTFTTPTQSIPVTVSFAITPPVAAITSLFPSSVPVDTNTSDTVLVVITGTGFVTAPSGEKTAVLLNTAADVLATVNVLSSTTITVTIPINVDTNYFQTAGTPVAIGVYNPTGGTVSAAQSSRNLAVTSDPVITSITSASSFLQASPGSNPTFAPYDIVSVFGTNFCPDCGGANPTVLSGTLDSYSRFPNQLSPDSGTHYVKVKFNKASDDSLVAQGYLLFATNTQVNALVPAGVSTLVGTGTVKVVVSYTGSTDSAAYLVNIAAADPGIFTTNSNGQGQGAILHADYSLNSSTNKATKGTTTILVYMTGLGAPTSASSNAALGTAATYAASCISALGATGPPAIAGYMTTINTAVTGYTPPGTPWTTIDGAVIQSSKIAAGHFPPCTGGITATIGGVAATVSYAGFVSDAVAGLYQVNMLVPSTVAVGQKEVLVTVGGVRNQPGVTVWVQ
jgi:uncharacterized protein (TIGR03437 family)